MKLFILLSFSNYGVRIGLKVFRLESFCDPFEGFFEPSCGLGCLGVIQVDGGSAFTDELIVTLHPFHRFLGRLAAVRASDRDFNLVNDSLHPFLPGNL